ncbi:MAG TPA: pyridoxal phosphate-dependent aminotransferase [Candidatus Thermoplasmatota archaeon]|nr:pyridoxal phosphate-dependent aminotransferase [Candidatus Thermoplasmatota archaeon]
MDFEPFGLHDWLVEHEERVKVSLAHSGILPLPARELGVDGDALLSGDLGYGPIPNDPKLGQRIASLYGLRDVVVTLAGSEANFLAFAATLKRGDKVVVERPTYSPLRAIPKALGCKVVEHPRTWANKLRLDLGKLDAQLKGAKLFVATNLNNPTGVGISTKELEELAQIAEKRKCLVLLDEAYRELAWEPPPVGALVSDRFLSTATLTKCWGLAGLRTGWLAGADKVLQRARVAKSYASISNPPIEQRLALAALDQRDALLARARRIRDANFAAVKGWLDGHAHLAWVQPDGGPICAPRLPKGVDDEAFARALVEQHSTLIAPGSRMGLKGHFRLGYGGHPDSIAPGLRNVDDTLGRMASKGKPRKAAPARAPAADDEDLLDHLSSSGGDV